ncbi:ABC transporter substrate-binding protein [Corynebacterium sp. TAE3-ERU12]|nr:ABC transporter substrate-binding protein [Corynebacterium sp. TAE3-ERU12]MBV7294644.1 ABC transporter substrate-binding protein [Corynebacterium sp. TAE3-ERU12]
MGLAACSAVDNITGSEGRTVTVTHAWGTDEYPYKPKKVVAIGTGVDNLLALGITPEAIVVRPDDESAVWKKDELKDVKKIESADVTAVPVEEIAELKPDLIVGDSYRVSQPIYEMMSPVAPVLGGIGTDGEGLGWKPQLVALGRIFGEEKKAQKIIEEDEQRFEELKQRLPGLAGKTALIAQHRGGQFYVIADPQNPSNDFFSQLGMELPELFASGEIPATLGRAAVSPENVEDLKANLLVLYAADGMDAVRKVPGYDELPEVEKGTAMEHNEPVSAALNVPSPLNRKWALEQLTPLLEKVAKQK